MQVEVEGGTGWRWDDDAKVGKKTAGAPRCDCVGPNLLPQSGSTLNGLGWDEESREERGESRGKGTTIGSGAVSCDKVTG